MVIGDAKFAPPEPERTKATARATGLDSPGRHA